MERNSQGNPIEYPPCNLSGNIWFEANGTPEDVRTQVETSLGISFEDTGTEPGEHSYDSRVFGFDIGLRISTNWRSGILCRLLAMSNSNHGIYDFSAPPIPFERHLAKLVEVYQLGRLISFDEVKARRLDERGGGDLL